MSGDAETVSTPEWWSARAAIEDPCEAVMWSREGQSERFDAVMDILPIGCWGGSVLDFGCGTGALSERFSGLHIPYLGYDWSHPMVLRARLEHPRSEFVSTLPWRHFDAIVCVGTFNMPGSYADTWKTLAHLWDRTDYALIVSLYRGDDSRCLTYDPYDLCDFASPKTDRWRIEQIRHNDLLLVMWK
jgi:SAM-dependent methyltransferase